MVCGLYLANREKSDDVFADHLESQGSIAKLSGDATRHLAVMGNYVLNSVIRGERTWACQFGACFKVCLSGAFQLYGRCQRAASTHVDGEFSPMRE